MLKLKKLEDIFLFLILLFLPTQLGKHFWPQFSHIYSLKIDYLSPTVYFWDLLVMGLLVVWILNKPRANKLALNLFLVFLLTQVLSLLAADNPGAGLVRLEQYLLTGSFGVFLASQNFKNLLGKISLPLSLAVVSESTLAILQFIEGGNLGLWILGERTFSISTPGIAKFDFFGLEFLRPYGSFPHPNVLAGYLLIAIIILSFRSSMAKIAVVFAGLTIFLTMSRTAIAAGLILLIIFLRRKSIIFIMVMMIIITILSPVLFTRFSAVFNFDNLTLLRREELIDNAWQIFLKYPLFGVGLNNFIPAMASDLVTGPSRFLQPVHNIFLLALSETGLAGLVGFFLLVGFPIRFIVYSLSFIGKTKSVVTINHIPYTILLLWLIILFLGMFDHYFLTLPQGYRLLFLVWGLTFSVIKYSRE